MTFREQLQRIVEAVPGASACALMGFDGIAIDSFEANAGPLDIPTLLSEYAAATQNLRGSGQQQSGRVHELTIATGTLTAVMRPLNDEYFLAVVLAPSGLLGKARFIMRLAVPALLKELA